MPTAPLTQSALSPVWTLHVHACRDPVHGIQYAATCSQVALSAVGMSSHLEGAAFAWFAERSSKNITYSKSRFPSFTCCALLPCCSSTYTFVETISRSCLAMLHALSDINVMQRTRSWHSSSCGAWTARASFIIRPHASLTATDLVWVPRLAYPPPGFMHAALLEWKGCSQPNGSCEGGGTLLIMTARSHTHTSPCLPSELDCHGGCRSFSCQDGG